MCTYGLPTSGINSVLVVRSVSHLGALSNTNEIDDNILKDDDNFTAAVLQMQYVMVSAFVNN